MPTLQAYKGGYYLWHYIPSQVAAIIFALLFVGATALHGWKMFTTRMWFCLAFFIGGIFEVIGYIGRAAAYDKTGDLIPYIIQSIFLLLAPVLFAASLYMTYGRCVLAVEGSKFSPISPRWTTRVFVFGDVFSFVIQSSGAGLLVKGSDPSMGEKIIVGGLIFQVLIFAFFIFVAYRFNAKFRKDAMAGRFPNIPWQACLNMLYLTSMAIMIRNIFRVVEYAMGNDGYLLANEWPVYVFDGALMLVTMIAYFWWYPSQLKNKDAGSLTELTDVEEAGQYRGGSDYHK